MEIPHRVRDDALFLQLQLFFEILELNSGLEPIVEKSSTQNTGNRKSIPELIQKAVQWILIKLVRFYQLTISPYLGPSCRHTPSCSNYMIGAIREWGAVIGVWMGLKRLVKCHPWGTSGYDPVPKRNESNEEKDDE